MTFSATPPCGEKRTAVIEPLQNYQQQQQQHLHQQKQFMYLWME